MNSAAVVFSPSWVRRAWRQFQRRQSDAERVADPQQGPQAGVRRALLDVDHHPAAHRGSGRQLIERPTPRLPLLPDPGADRQRQGGDALIH
jgi:hypothetical protein